MLFDPVFTGAAENAASVFHYILLTNGALNRHNGKKQKKETDR